MTDFIKAKQRGECVEDLVQSIFCVGIFLGAAK